jgi:hypothetical protein
MILPEKWRNNHYKVEKNDFSSNSSDFETLIEKIKSGIFKLLKVKCLNV